MTNAEFREWLKGFFEVSGDKAALDPARLQIVVNHLNLAESVDRELDAFNAQLRADILEFRKSPQDYAALTADIRQRLFG